MGSQTSCLVFPKFLLLLLSSDFAGCIAYGVGVKQMPFTRTNGKVHLFLLLPCFGPLSCPSVISGTLSLSGISLSSSDHCRLLFMQSVSLSTSPDSKNTGSSGIHLTTNRCDAYYSLHPVSSRYPRGFVLLLGDCYKAHYSSMYSCY